MMFSKTKERWKIVGDDFDPRTLGWEYNIELSILGLVRELLQQFAQNCPDPTNPKRFIGAINFDPYAYWHLREELKRIAQFENTEPFSQFTENETLFGYPCFITGVEGIALALKPILAPALLRQQIHFSGGKNKHYGEMDKEGEESPTKKEDLH